jgi:putative DNA primase/helicase
MLLGSGANGKSTLLNLLTALVGKVNVSNVALHRLDEDKFAAASLYGKLVNSFADLDSRALQASSIFKSITGGDSIVGERKYADPFTFRPYARLLFSANEPPPTPDNSDAFFRRWVVMPFERRFDGKGADRNLTAKLTTDKELSGLLNKGIERLPDLRKRGAFTLTEASMSAADRFRVDADSVAGFLDDQCDLSAGLRTPQADLFPAYRNWCSESNRRPLGKQRFNRRLLELAPSILDLKSGGVRYWDGLGLPGGNR